MGGIFECGNLCWFRLSLTLGFGVYYASQKKSSRNRYHSELARRFREDLILDGKEARSVQSYLAAVAHLAADYGLPCQVSLEEFMACAVGGCAGCTVRINTPAGPAMKRVCVDGPVFDAQAVDWG